MRWFVFFLDTFEDRVRRFLSRRPHLYAFFAGVAIVLFWRGVWMLADELALSPLWSLVASLTIMFVTGTFVSFFIGEDILISGLREEKRIDEKTATELRMEEKRLADLHRHVTEIRMAVQRIERRLDGRGG